jgi:hypothetical protein
MTTSLGPPRAIAIRPSANFFQKTETDLEDQQQLARAGRHSEGEGRFLSAVTISVVGGNSEVSA